MRLPLPMTSLIASMTDGRAEARFNGSRRRRGPFAAAALLGCALAVSGCQDEVRQIIVQKGTVNGVYSNKTAAEWINNHMRDLALFHDRVGSVIAGDRYLQGYFGGVVNLFPPDQVDELIRGLLEDDDKMVAHLMGILGVSRGGYGGDGTFLGQWGLHQTDAMLEAYIRSQLKVVKGKEPSPEGRNWVEEVYGRPIRSVITDPELLRLIGFDDVPVTPGLGS